MYPIIANFFIKNNRSDYVHLSYYILYILWSCVYHVTIIYSGRSFYVFTMIDYGNLATSYKSIEAFFFQNYVTHLFGIKLPQRMLHWHFIDLNQLSSSSMPFEAIFTIHMEIQQAM